jgi:hypothetical protein
MVLLGVKVPFSAIGGQNVVWLLSNVELWYSSMSAPSWEWGVMMMLQAQKYLWIIAPNY